MSALDLVASVVTLAYLGVLFTARDDQLSDDNLVTRRVLLGIDARRLHMAPPRPPEHPGYGPHVDVSELDPETHPERWR